MNFGWSRRSFLAAVGAAGSIFAGPRIAGASIFGKKHKVAGAASVDGVQIVPIFLTNTGSFYYQGPGIFVAASAAPQTMSFDYSSLNLPGDATSMQVRFQGSNGNPISLYMDNVRVGSTITLTNANAQWSTGCHHH